MPELPPEAETLFFAGNHHMQTGEKQAAQTCFEQAVQLAPEMAEAWANLALLQEQAGDVVSAETSHRRAISLQPDTAQIYLNLSALLINSKRLVEAELLARQALVLAPDSPAAYSNLGMVLACAKREVEAEQCYRQALALNPGYAKARFNLSYILLRQGRFEEGWQCYEARRTDPVGSYFEFPRWQGEPLTGQRIILGIEGGFGDMIQFCRYAQQLKSLGASWVSVLCHPPLKTLFASLLGVDEVFSYEDNVPKTGWDFWSPPMSLPLHCHIRLDNIPHFTPYLAADSSKAAHWTKQLPIGRPRVGLVWQGNPKFENDSERSLPSARALAPLLVQCDVQFVSLQKGTAERALAQLPVQHALVNAGEQLQDFSDTAAVIANLDLVISIDSAVAHLTGALGKPCWLLLPDYRTDWRWLAARTDTPWYPHTRLFRQAAEEEWAAVIARVAVELRAWADDFECFEP